MSPSTHPSRQPIAVIGVSALFPGSTDADGFWRDILHGRDLLTDVPASHWRIDDYYDPDPAAPDKTYARRGGFLGNVDFDALGWGVPPSTLPATDTAQLLALIVAQSVLQDAAGAAYASMDRSRISVILGVTSAQELLFSMVSRLQRPVWVKALRESGLPESEVQAACDRIAAQYVPWQEASFPGLLGNVVAGRIANRLNLGGTNCVTDAACASTFSALSMAVNELQLGHSDMVISGGVDTLNDIFMYMCFSKTPALSPSGDCRPFSDQADGTMLGEGLGMVALKRLEDAERDGDRIYAVIRGIGTSSDGRSKSVYAPVAAGQAQALRRAYEIAGYGADTVELVEAHGTGTKAGDVAEFEGLRTVFAETDAGARQWCALGSVKSQIGHTKAAAGAAGLFKVVMALHHKVLPPTIKVAAPNPRLQLEQSPFYLNTELRPWIRGRDHPRRASVSAFGFGGSNFHVTLEEYAGPAPRAERLATQSHELVLVSADAAADLLSQIDTLVEQTSSPSLARIARDSRMNWRAEHGHRLAVVVDSMATLQARLAAARGRIESTPETSFELPDGSAYGVGAALGEVALLFPGQGSQYPGMGCDLALQFESARRVWDLAADIEMDGERLQSLMFPRPLFDDAARAVEQARLTRTEWAQPALAAHSGALLQVLREFGIREQHCAGHSFGEVMALHAAGVFDLKSALRIARRRGELMRDASTTPGAMTALSMAREQAQTLIAEHAPDLVIANHNAPQQVIVSGPKIAIESFESLLQTRSVVFRRLPVSTAFHSALVSDCQTAFAATLDAFEMAAPRVPVYSNATAQAHADDADRIRTMLAAQLAHPVRFVEMVEAMYAAGARIFVEVGPGAVLSGLVSSIFGSRAHAALPLDRKGRSGVENLLIGLARLAAAGVPMQIERLYADIRLPSEPASKPGMSIPINGSNHGKPYPPLDASSLPPPNPPRALDAAAPAAVPAADFAATAAPPLGLQPQPERASVTPPTFEHQDMSASTPALVASSDWLQILQENQLQTAAAHEQFQRTMAESHAAYLRLSESALLGLTALAQPGAVVPRPGAVPGSSAAAQTSALSACPPTPTRAASAPGQHSGPATAAAPAGVVVETPSATAPASMAVPVAAPLAPAGVALEPLLLAIVAEKTGYPVEMLQLDMDLEGDLGIDSIKRVEILAAVDERAPQLPKLDRARLGALHTLREILGYLQAAAPAALNSVAAPTPSTAAGPAPAAPSQIAASDLELEPLLLAVVAEKTGYPVEMLQLDMDLEGDLGIDSIKRVEILAAVDERAPQLPKLDRARLGALHTLREILGYLQAAAPAATATMAAPAVRVPAVDTAPPIAPQSKGSDSALDLEALLLAVVAEKTGYPVEMLQLDMDLEGDLGIDSIKRVEILAAIDERAPQLPKLDRARLGALHTLREILGYLQGAGAAAVAQSAVRLDAMATAAAKPDIARYVVKPIAAPASGLALPGLLSGQPLCITGHAGIAPLLAAELLRRGVNATAVAALPDSATACVYLGGLRPLENFEAAAAINREAFQLARALAPRLQSAPGLLVTVQDSGCGPERNAIDSVRSWMAGLPALLKTCALEWPLAAVKSIDVDAAGRSPQAMALQIADELLEGGGEVEVLLAADGGRSTLHCVEHAVVPGDAVIATGDLVVVSGGARGVTAACVLEWARRCRPRLLLLGRSPLIAEPEGCADIEDAAALKRVLLSQAQSAGESLTPAALSTRVQALQASREVRASLAALQQQGCSARYEAVSIRDAAGLQRVLDQARRDWGPIRGVVHAAGVLADKRIADKTDAQFDQVFDTKVAGLHALLEATRDDPLKLLCVFSSVSARCGNTGQSDYAMANEVLARVMETQSRLRPQLRVKSLGWGPWEGGMVTPQLKARFAALGVPMIPLQLGATMFADEMEDAGADSVNLVLGGAPRAEALLFDGAEARVEALEVNVRRASHAYLEGHSVNGVPVVPVVLVAEWLARAARSFRPGLELVALHELKVLKGIRLAGFENGGDCLRIEARPSTNAAAIELEMSVRDTSGRLRYSARAELHERVAVSDQTRPDLSLERWPGTSPYPDLLFHRGPFELIEQMQGISDHGIAAQVRGVQTAQWPKQSWQLDVAALDGGLQLAVLFGQRMLGGSNLPTAIDSLRRYGPAACPGPITATAYRRAVSAAATTTDIVFTDAGGRRFAECLGVHNHALTAA